MVTWQAYTQIFSFHILHFQRDKLFTILYFDYIFSIASRTNIVKNVLQEKIFSISKPAILFIYNSFLCSIFHQINVTKNIEFAVAKYIYLCLYTLCKFIYIVQFFLTWRGNGHKLYHICMHIRFYKPRNPSRKRNNEFQRSI